MQVLPRASIRVAFSARCKLTSVRRLSVSLMASKAPIYGELIAKMYAVRQLLVVKVVVLTI